MGMRNWHPYLADTLREMHAAGRAPRHRLHRRRAALLFQLSAVPGERGGGARRAARARRRHRHHLRRAAGSIIRGSLRPTRRTWATRWPASTRRCRTPRAWCARRTASPRRWPPARATASSCSSRRGSWPRRRASATGRWSSRAAAAGPKIRGSSPTSATTCAPRRPRGCRRQCCCPIGFVCDHIEVLYDLDREAAEVCAEIGLPMVRAESVNDDPRFLDMMADMVLRTIRRHEARPAAAAGAGRRGRNPGQARAPGLTGCCILVSHHPAEPTNHTLFRPPLSKQFADVAVSPRDDFGARLTRWFYEGHLSDHDHGTPSAHTAAWWKVMCLTGVDYFSTLAYQPSIAFVAAGALSPVATLVLVALTLFGAFPMYSRVADLSPWGQGSILILEKLFPRWKGKAVVLCLLGFAGTGFVITVTLSAADAAAHLIHNPLAPPWLDHPLLLTIGLLLILGAVFLKGFQEAIMLAVGIVAVYITLNVVVIAAAVREIWQRPEVVANWKAALLHRARPPGDDDRDGADPVPEAGAGAVGIRDRRGRHAAGARRRHRHRSRAGGPDPQHQEAAARGGADHERDADGQQLRDGRADSAGGVRARAGRRRPCPVVSRPRAARHHVRHRLRRGDDPHPVVCRLVGAGRPADADPALPAALRHGAGVGARQPAAGRHHHRHRHRDLDRVRGQRRRAGRCLRHRRAGAHDLGRAGDCRGHLAVADTAGCRSC